MRPDYNKINMARERFNRKAEQLRISEVARIANYIQTMMRCTRSEALRLAEEAVEQVRYL